MQNNFNKMLAETLGFEGGMVVDPAGGLTNYGITQSTLDNYRKQKKMPAKSVKDLTTEDVINLYKDEFYKKPKINKLPPGVSSLVFDHGVNSGPANAIKALQGIIGSRPDGIIGPKTITKTNDFIKKNGVKKIIEQLLNVREENYKNLVEQNPELNAQFANGWQNRINKLRKIYLSEQ